MALGLLVAVTSVQAKPEFFQTFLKTYNLGADSPAAQAKCSNCHVRPPIRNPYGKDLEAAMDAAGQKALTPEILHALETKDSLGEGHTNLERILRGTSAAKSPVATGGKAEAPTGGSALFPPHSYHPLLVHFPIALFLFGAFLEVLAVMRGLSQVRELAAWNLGFGAIAGCCAAATGLIAVLRLGWSFQGNVLIHLLLAASALVLMVVLALWRRSKTPNTPAYWALLAVSCIVLGLAGFFGAGLVFG